jgi:integrase
MARSTRDPRLENRTARLALPVRKNPYSVRVGLGVRLAYRRNRSDGVWSVICADGAGSSWLKRFALADDYQDADGTRVMDYWQAQRTARGLARSGKGAAEEGGRPLTIAEAVNRYEADLIARGADPANARRLRFDITPSFGSRVVAMMGPSDFRAWRDAMIARGVKPVTARRQAKSLAAALSLAASMDERIGNRAAWVTGLGGLRDAEASPRNVVVSEADIRRIVDAAHALDEAFGLFVETAATTGGRPVQLGRANVADLQPDRLMMPSSKKGSGEKRITRVGVPLPAGLARRLAKTAEGRSPDAPLLPQADGQRRGRQHGYTFAKAVRAAGLDPKVITIYALRHSYITRALLGNVPIRLIAAQCDTSVPMIERAYSAYIAGHGDAIARKALIDFDIEPVADNVIPARRTRPDGLSALSSRHLKESPASAENAAGPDHEPSTLPRADRNHVHRE